ncbi:MAG: glycosyltransferase [Phycisphaerae bacterium]
MKISILTLGTRGDVQPYLALAAALAARHHSVTLAAPGDFQSWVEEYGLRFHSLGMEFQAFLQKPEVRRALTGQWFGLIRAWRRVIVPLMRDMLEGAWAAASDADVVIYHPKVIAAPDICERNGALPICAAVVPIFPTREFPLLVTSRNFGSLLNKFSYRLFSFSRLAYLSILNRWRRQTLGLGRGPSLSAPGSFRGRLHPRLCAISPALVPRPSDWDDGIHLTGAWVLPSTDPWQPDETLQRFLQQGPPPVYIGFGSMTTADPLGLTRTMIRAVERSGVRAILATGWGGLSSDEAPSSIHLLEGAPHDLLFPLCRAVVHHGGAGTTAAGLRAGLPTLICPFGVDQPFWGGRVSSLGCGPEPLPIKRVNADGMAARLTDLVNTEKYRYNARRIQAEMAKESGVETAADAIERMAMIRCV